MALLVVVGLQIEIEVNLDEVIFLLYESESPPWNTDNILFLSILHSVAEINTTQ